jgi:uncharacterized damage-inducible protein DinB
MENECLENRYNSNRSLEVDVNLFYTEYLGLLINLHTEVIKAIEELPQEALDFKPSEDIPSICVLVVHIAGAERYWIGDVAAMDPSDREREAEFKARGLSASTLGQRLDISMEYARTRLSSMSMEDLADSRVSPRDSRQFTVSWALLHALEHTAIHLGHIQIIRQLWRHSHP